MREKEGEDRDTNKREKKRKCSKRTERRRPTTEQREGDRETTHNRTDGGRGDRGRDQETNKRTEKKREDQTNREYFFKKVKKQTGERREGDIFSDRKTKTLRRISLNISTLRRPYNKRTRPRSDTTIPGLIDQCHAHLDDTLSGWLRSRPSFRVAKV